MKNYRVKIKDLYPGMSFYHMEKSCEYKKNSTYIIKVDKKVGHNPKKPSTTDYVRVYTLDTHGCRGIIYTNGNDYVYPVNEEIDVTVLNKFIWRFRQLIIYLLTPFLYIYYRY